MPTPNIIELRLMNAAELGSAIENIDGELTELNLTISGEARADLSDADLDRSEALLNLRGRAESLLRAREQYEKHPGSVRTAMISRGDGRPAAPGLIYSSIPSHDSAELLRMSDQQLRDTALRFLENAGREFDLRSDQQDQMDKLLRTAIGKDSAEMDGSKLARRLLLTESPAYRSAFQEVITNPYPVLTAEEGEALRAVRAEEMRGMSENVTTAGGFGVPTLLDPSLLLTSGASAAPVLDICRQVPSNTNLWKGVSTAPPTWSWDTEGAAVSDDSPVLAQPSITVHMARGFIPASIELTMDYPDFAGEISRVLEQGWVDTVAAATVTGSGSGQPYGVFTKLDATAASEIVVTTFAQLGAVDVFKVWNALPERFRSRADWLMSVSAESQIRSFSSANQSSAYFTVDLTADGLSRLNGRPVRVTDYAPTFTAGSAGHQNYVVVGDFSNYVWVRRMDGMKIEPINHLLDTTTGRPTGTRGFFAYSRAGGDATVTQAFRLLNTT
jgi:HK97 family phage major capsid protein